MNAYNDYDDDDAPKPPRGTLREFTIYDANWAADQGGGVAVCDETGRCIEFQVHTVQAYSKARARDIFENEIEPEWDHGESDVEFSGYYEVEYHPKSPAGNNRDSLVYRAEPNADVAYSYYVYPTQEILRLAHAGHGQELWDGDTLSPAGEAFVAAIRAGGDSDAGWTAAQPFLATAKAATEDAKANALADQWLTFMGATA
jgi:hypothetical protein